MKGSMLCAWAILGSWTVGGLQARGLYSDGFDPPVISPLFPPVANGFELPPGPAVTQLTWLLGELAVGQTTSVAEVNAHFDPALIAQVGVGELQARIQTARTAHPGAVVTDVVAVTPVRITVVVDAPGSAFPSGFLNLGARFTGSGLINQFSVGDYYGSVQYPEDQALTLAQAADTFITLSSAPSLLVGRINRVTGQCTEIIGRNAATPRATASIFKTWVLGGVGRAIARNDLASADVVPMVASELAPGGVINLEPVGTPFTVRDLAILMMGISDNTATDLLHEAVGRDAIEQVVVDYGVAQPALLTPFLNISEQFHVFRSFDLPTATSYVDGSEAFQEQFLHERIEPLGPLTTYPHFHTQLLTSTWQASPFDVCRAFGALRRLPQGSEALATVDAALGAGVAQPGVRNRWDRAWYKGGSLAITASSFVVLTHAWMLENAGEDPYVVVALSNHPAGGINQFFVQSITGRLLELVAMMP